MQDCELCRPDSHRVIWKNERFPTFWLIEKIFLCYR